MASAATIVVKGGKDQILLHSHFYNSKGYLHLHELLFHVYDSQNLKRQSQCREARPYSREESIKHRFPSKSEAFERLTEE